MQVLILHHLPLKQLQNLELPIPLLRLVLQVQKTTCLCDHITFYHHDHAIHIFINLPSHDQAREPGLAHQLVKSSWLHRIGRYDDKVLHLLFLLFFLLLFLRLPVFLLIFILQDRSE